MNLSTYSGIDNSQSYRIIFSNAQSLLILIIRISFYSLPSSLGSLMS